MKVFSLTKISLAVAATVALSFWLDGSNDSQSISNNFEIDRPQLTNPHTRWLIRPKSSDRSVRDFK